MFQNIKKGILSLTTLYMLFCAYFFIEVMKGFIQVASTSESRVIPLLMILGLGVVIKKSKINTTSLTKVSFLFGGYMSIVTFCDLGFNVSALSNVFSSFFWILVFNQVSSMKMDEYKFDITILLMSVMCNIISFIFVFDVFPQIQFMEHITRIGAFNSIYYVLITFPFIFLFRNWLWSIFFSIMPLYAFIVSGKTTCLLCGISILTFYIYRNIKNLKQKSRVLFILVIVSVCCFAYKYIDFASVLESSREDFSTGGNGRTEISTKVYHLLINESNLFKIIFGHGVNAISRTIGIGGHNDFLEVLYCYGLIGFTLFISFLVHLFKEIRTFISSTHRIAFSISLIVLFFALIASKLIATQIGLLPLSIFWGTLIAFNRSQIKSII